MREKIYVGIIDGNRERFTSLTVPTEESHPWYTAVIGPFKTARAAKWCVDHPHAQCANIKAFEQAALGFANQSELIKGYTEHLNKQILDLDK